MFDAGKLPLEASQLAAELTAFLAESIGWRVQTLRPLPTPMSPRIGSARDGVSLDADVCNGSGRCLTRSQAELVGLASRLGADDRRLKGKKSDELVDEESEQNAGEPPADDKIADADFELDDDAPPASPMMERKSLRGRGAKRPPARQAFSRGGRAPR